MRALRWFVASAVVGSTLALPGTSMANGGAYIEFRPTAGRGGGTHFLTGGPATGVATVFVPPRKEVLFDRGPFFAFLLPSGAELREGRPIPDGAMGLGTFEIEKRRKDRFDLTVDFTVPQVAGGSYAVGLCNDPCTISGFRESLLGFISVVATAREARLLTTQSRLRGQLYTAHRELRRTERHRGQLESLLDTRERDAAEAGAEAASREAELRRALAASRAEARDESGRATWATWLAVIATIAAAVLLLRRRRPTIIVPDTIEELEESAREPAET
jgi:hypothetical protein